jgi:hypothetical protein
MMNEDWLEQLIEDVQKDQVGEHHSGRPVNNLALLIQIIGVAATALLIAYMIMTL